MSETIKKEEVVLNEERISKDEFEEKKEDLEKKPGVKVVKVGEDKFRTQIQG